MIEHETKSRILETAMELIWLSSYDSVGVGDICKQAKVNKGSFYHFFVSKEALAAEALEEAWKRYQPQLDQIFSPEKDAIQRLMDYCDFSLKMQEEKKQKFGFVCGCPYTSIGIEQSPQSQMLRKTVEKRLDGMKKYFMQAIQDAVNEGCIQGIDAKKKADEIHTFYLGALAQARIYNDLKYISGMKEEFKRMLGVKKLQEVITR